MVGTAAPPSYAMESPYWVMRDDLLAFTQYTLPGYEISWHHQLIADALEKVARGEIKRLIIDVPPQRGKSELASIRFLAWLYANNPDKRIILTSYAAEAAERFSREARDLIGSDRFKAVYPELALSPTAAGVGFWRLNQGRGYVRATGVGGPVTSFGADLFLIDDPLKDREEADSDVIRAKIKDWFTSVTVSRLAPGAAIIVIQTRWHEDDLAGWLLETQGDRWTRLHIPAVTEDRVVWPERWSREDYAEIESEVGERDWNALYQGNPVPPEGTTLKRKWFTISPRAPEDLRWIRMWDIAVSEKSSADWTVGIKLAVDSLKTLWIQDVIRGQWNWPEARRRILQTADQDGPDVHVFAERPAFGGKIAGIDVAKDLLDNWERIDIPFRLVDPVGDIVHGLNLVAARAEAGRVVLVQGDWNDAFLKEICGIPHTKNDDQGAALVLGARQLAKQRLGDTSNERRAPTRSVRGLNRLADRYERQTAW